MAAKSVRDPMDVDAFIDDVLGREGSAGRATRPIPARSEENTGPRWQWIKYLAVTVVVALLGPVGGYVVRSVGPLKEPRLEVNSEKNWVHLTMERLDPGTAFATTFAVVTTKSKERWMISEGWSRPEGVRYGEGDAPPELVNPNMEWIIPLDVFPEGEWHTVTVYSFATNSRLFDAWARVDDAEQTEWENVDPTHFGGKAVAARDIRI